MLRVFQFACIATTALILYALMSGFDVLSRFFGEGFDWGVVVGGFFTIAVYLLICWVDPSSRPRGRS